MPTERGQYAPPPTDQILSKLAWLQGRAQPDFKGHVPKAEPKLTVDSVRAKKNAEQKLRCGAGDFLPFQNATNKNIRMRFDATKVNVLKKDKENAFPPQSPAPTHGSAHPNNNAYHQELDPTSGRPLMNTVLSYNEDQFIPQPRPTGRRTFPDRNAGMSIFDRSSSASAATHRPIYEEVRESTPGQRLEVLRADLMRHPMFTATSKIAHTTTHWDPMTQLMAHQFSAPPPRKERPTLQQKRNPVRMVEVMRRSNSAKPWH